MARRFLEHITLGSFGAFEDRTVGPFSPGMNVVFGPNEAGKSTVAAFVGGALFGWDEAAARGDNYVPASGKRSGELGFASVDAGEQLAPCPPLRRNETTCENVASYTRDIDRETFHTVFSLSSDELRRFRNTTDVTARLLTAGSGTGSSPAGAFVEVEQRIAAHMSREQDAEGSVLALADALEAKRKEVTEAGERVEQVRALDREYRGLAQSRATTVDLIGDLEREVSEVNAAKSQFESIDSQLRERTAELAALEQEMDLEQAQSDDGAPFDSRVLALDPKAERAVRDRLDDFAEEQAKATRALDMARENASASAAAYDALCELDNEESPKGNPLQGRTSQVVVSIALPLLFVVAGVPLFVHARQISSLSITALAIGLIVLAFFLAAGAIVVLFRRDGTAQQTDARRRDAQWVMVQDRKKLDASTAAKQRIDDELRSYLEEIGLSQADGSVKQARALLDDARDERTRLATDAQRAASIELRIAQVKSAISALKQQRIQLEDDLALPDPITTRVLASLAARKAAQLETMRASYEDMNVRFGELKGLLDTAALEREFDTRKMEYQQIRTRLIEAKNDLIVLLLAKRMLEKGIASWESRSQPEIYREASRLLSIVTDGAWTNVALSAGGRLTVTNAAGEKREPSQLSPGTCQQLYLALRIALLSLATDVGSAIPVLADDLLVNFDAQRRLGAARALVELSAKRQVIMFTCHKEVVESVRLADAGCTYLEL